MSLPKGTALVLCRRPILDAVNPCQVEGCKHDRIEGRTMCQIHIDMTRRRYLRVKAMKAAK